MADEHDNTRARTDEYDNEQATPTDTMTENSPEIQTVQPDDHRKQGESVLDEVMDALLDWTVYLNNKKFNDPSVVAISDNYAVIRSGLSFLDTDSFSSQHVLEDYAELFLYNVIDKDNQCHAAFLAPLAADIIINNDGLMSITNLTYGDGHTEHRTRILDKNANVLLDATVDFDPIIDEGSMYCGVAECGNVLRTTLVSDFEHGEMATVDLMQSDGKVLAEVVTGKDVSVSYLGLDIYCIQYTDMDTDKGHIVLCDATSGRIQDGVEYFSPPICDAIVVSDKLLFFDNFFVNADLESWMGFTRETPYDCYSPMIVLYGDPELHVVLDFDLEHYLNDKYFWGEDGFYNLDSTMAKELPEGNGIKQAAYMGDRYCILTNSGWYYALDENLERMTEPVQFGEENVVRFTAYGIVARTDSDGADYSLYDFDGSYVCDLEGIEGGDEIRSFAYGNYNLATRSQMTLTTYDITKMPVFYGDGTTYIEP